MDIIKYLLSKFQITERQLKNLIRLSEEGNEVPFIARYKKDEVGDYDDVTVLHDILKEYEYQTNLQARKTSVRELLNTKGLLTDEISANISNFTVLAHLNAYYDNLLPREDSPKQKALKKGLGNIAKVIKEKPKAIEEFTSELKVLIEEKSMTPEEVYSGVCDILVTDFIADPHIRELVEPAVSKEIVLDVKLKKGADVDSFKFLETVTKPTQLKGNQVMKLARANREKQLTFSLDCGTNSAYELINKATPEVESELEMFRNVAKTSAYRAFVNYHKGDILKDTKADLLEEATAEAIKVFETNLRALLLAKPAHGVILGFDPGYTNGCKLAVIDETGQFVSGTDRVIYPFRNKNEAMKVMDELFDKYQFEFVALGNGTAVIESKAFIKEWQEK